MAEDTNISKKTIEGTESSAGSDAEKDWRDYYNETKQNTIVTLRELGQKGDATALIILAERYISSSNRIEYKEGFSLLDKAEELLKDDFARDGSSFSKDALIYLFDLKGNSYLEKLDAIDDYQGSVSKEIFDAFSNAYELDHSHAESLAVCYERGIGVERDPEKAKVYRGKALESGGIWDKIEYAGDMLHEGGKLIGIEWLQRALIAEDADKHPAAKHYARLRLYQHNEKDENGSPIDAEEEIEELKRLAESHDAEAAMILGDSEENDEQKLYYYRLGINGTHEDFASKCRERADSIQEKIDDIRAEEARKAEEEAARKAAEEEQKEKEAKRRHTMIIGAIAAAVIIVLLIGISTINKAMKRAEDEEDEVEESAPYEETVDESDDQIMIEYDFETKENKEHLKKIIIDKAPSDNVFCKAFFLTNYNDDTKLVIEYLSIHSIQGDDENDEVASTITVVGGPFNADYNAGEYRSDNLGPFVYQTAKIDGIEEKGMDYNRIKSEIEAVDPYFEEFYWDVIDIEPFDC